MQVAHRLLSMLVAALSAASVVLVGLYLAYGVAAGYIGVLPTPLNLLAGSAILVSALAVVAQLAVRSAAHGQPSGRCR